ncbi:hypothetical protein [Bdellovibrio reynosensis]|uniref:Lysine-specific metallo-endopeptidase domain-containing protein n=1 Tax=Bdellovibrio reynosensis TaxID=2835041 RepID=A0ABY4C8Q2_9BACT|nr:hypothetical protein [Bdellovibrio reynosensis]UOF01356.1 hypothetical protein MNR06_00110 [Bdellovibrio reynosensis]
MKILLSAISFILAGMGSSAFAAECVSQKEMAEIASHFSQFKNLATKEYCYDGSQTANLIATVMYMRKTAFAADMKPSQDELFSGRFAQSWYQYFIGRIDEMDVQASCPKGVGAFVYGWGNTMYVCPMMLTDSFSAIDRASVFMHEARHIDGFPHITCRSGARKNLAGACDNRISDGGSYAVTVETYAQLAKYATDLHPALRAYSMATAATYAEETFEVPARVNHQDNLLLMAESRDLFLMDVQNAFRMEAQGQTPALGHLVLRGQHMILFPDDKAQTARYLFTKNAGEIAQSAGDAVVEYNSKSAAERSRLVDLHIAAQWVGKIYTDKVNLACDPRSAAATDLSFNGVTAVGILYINGYTRTADVHYVMTSTGTIYEFGCPGGRPTLRPSSVKLDQRYKRVHKVGNKVMALTFDGLLYQINGTQEAPVKTSIDGHIHEIVPHQTYQFLEMH